MPVAVVTSIVANDPSSSRLVYSIIVVLAVIGVVLVGVAVWLIRSTRVDPELLAPLERMDERAWRSKDPATQRRLLDEVRPPGAEPLQPSKEEPAVDEEFEEDHKPVPTFDDLAAIDELLFGNGVIPATPEHDDEESPQEVDR